MVNKPNPSSSNVDLIRCLCFSIVSDCLRYMQEGSDFLKVRSYARQFRRLYKLNETFTAISWYPTSKKPSKATSA